MKKKILFSLVSMILLFLGAIDVSGREVFNINRNWKFFSSTDISSDAALYVNLPHIWNHDALSGKRDYFRGMGNYHKEINIPNSWRGKRIFIRSYGANSISNVLINGKHIGEHRAGYTSFAYDITDHIQFGKNNSFWIIVNNSPQLDVLPVAGDQNSYGGLFRDIELVVTGRDIVSLTDYGSDGIYIKQKSVTRERVNAEALIMLNGVRDNNVTAVLTVTDSDNEPVTSESVKVRLNGRMTSEVNIPFGFDNPRLWDGEADPYMYNVQVKVLVGEGAVSDSVTIQTGFRSISTSPDGQFMLNGEPYKLKGVIVTQDRAMAGTAITKSQVEEDFDLITKMGANAVRIKGVCHHPEFYNLCDKYGILVWNDLPLMGAVYLTDRAFINTESFRANGLYQANEIIRQKYNHPSVVMWGLFSNMGTRGDSPIDYITKLNMSVKREDPSRLTVASSNDDGEINFITDLISWDHHFGWREGVPSDIQIWKRQLQLNWSNLKSAVSYSAGASIYHQSDTLAKPVFLSNWHPERWQTYLHEEYYKYLKNDNFWGMFVGNMFDYGAAGRVWGEGNGINDYGIVTFDRRYCKDAYYFYKANWYVNDVFVYISERRWKLRKNKTQNIRVYTNMPEAELYINGISCGSEKAENGTIVWKGMELQEGNNIIEVRSGKLFDKTNIEISKPNDNNTIM